MPCNEILNRVLDSNDFGVGGGSASALAGGMAAALVALVANLSHKKDFGLSATELSDMAREGEELSWILLDGAKKDAEAYRGITEAFSLPKGTEEEKTRRASAIQEGFKGAAAVPRDNAKLCHRVQKLAWSLVGRSNPSCGSDLAVGLYLADIAVLGCVLNIEANLGSIKDEETKSRFQEEANQLRSQVKLIKFTNGGNDQ